MSRATLFIAAAILATAGCATDTAPESDGVAAPTSSTADATTTMVAPTTSQPTTTSQVEPTTSTVMEPCEEYLGGFGLELHPTERVGPYYDAGGTNHRCVVTDASGAGWLVTVRVDVEPWTNARMAERFNPEYFLIEQRLEINDTDGIWFERDNPTCRTQNGQQICDHPNPDSEIRNTYLVCEGLHYDMLAYTLEGAESASPRTAEEYRQMQDEVFTAVCPTYLSSQPGV